jgi:hypothetical protein
MYKFRIIVRSTDPKTIYDAFVEESIQLVHNIERLRDAGEPQEKVAAFLIAKSGVSRLSVESVFLRILVAYIYAQTPAFSDN